MRETFCPWVNSAQTYCMLMGQCIRRISAGSTSTVLECGIEERRMARQKPVPGPKKDTLRQTPMTWKLREWGLESFLEIHRGKYWLLFFLIENCILYFIQTNCLGVQFDQYKQTGLTSNSYESKFCIKAFLARIWPALLASLGTWLPNQVAKESSKDLV